MLINKEYLKSLSPCEDRYKCYLENYKDWSGTLEQFLDLPELTHDDKKWVFVRSIDKDKLRSVAADFAERVLHIYENKYPNDDRPRKAIEAARGGDKGACADAYAAACAARTAAYADSAAAYAAADAAVAATAAAVYAASSAYAAANAAVYAAAYAAPAYADAYARKNEEKAQIEIMKKYASEALKGTE